jgi:hypothetical protein
MPINTEDKTTANWMKEAHKGYIRIGVLILLNKKPSHGYEIMSEIKLRTGGFWKPTAGGVYPILRDLEKTGYVKGEWHKQNNRNTLFQEFARDVLNIESAKLPIPVMPSPFAAFLEEENRKATNIKELEQQKRQLKQHVKMMQERLMAIDKELEEKKGKKK